METRKISLAQLLIDTIENIGINEKALYKFQKILEILDFVKLNNNNPEDAEWIKFVGESLTELQDCKTIEELEGALDDLYGSLATLRVVKTKNTMSLIVIINPGEGVGFQIDQDMKGNIICLGLRNLQYDGSNN